MKNFIAYIKGIDNGGNLSDGYFEISISENNFRTLLKRNSFSKKICDEVGVINLFSVQEKEKNKIDNLNDRTDNQSATIRMGEIYFSSDYKYTYGSFVSEYSLDLRKIKRYFEKGIYEVEIDKDDEIITNKIFFRFNDLIIVGEEYCKDFLQNMSSVILSDKQIIKIEELMPITLDNVIEEITIKKLEEYEELDKINKDSKIYKEYFNDVKNDYCCMVSIDKAIKVYLGNHLRTIESIVSQ